MIYGVIPVGGKGKRLGLPFSKEMLPQKDLDFYSPVLEHIVFKMREAGAEIIVFVHGRELKTDIRDHYNGVRCAHIRQEEPTFSGCLRDFYENLKPKDDDKILFGLPDSIFEGNLFRQLIKKDGIACGLFKTLPSTRVDRLDRLGNSFIVKSQLSLDTTEWFWGVLKFDGVNIRKMIEDGMFNQCSEIGHILNAYEKWYIHGGNYLDLGTWENLNEYWRAQNG